LHIIDNTWVFLINFFLKKTDMKFIILVSSLKEISPSVFSWKKDYIKNYDAILLSKYDSFLESSKESSVYPRNIHTIGQWTHSGKRLRMCQIVCRWRKHMAQIESWKEQTHWRILFENDTKRRIQQALCKNKKKMLYRDIT
jgi:hypothetical protein